jgi:lipoprotein signal peptidase
MTLISIGSILVISGLFSQANGGLGGIVAAAMGGIWWYVDMLPSEVGVGVVALSMIIAGAIFIRTRGAAA